MPVYTVGSQSDLPKSVMDYLANGASKGERNQKLFGAACQCRDCGLSQSVTETCLLDRAKNDGLSAAEARKTIESAYDRSARQPAHGAHGGNTAPSSSPASSNGQWPSPVPLPVPTGLDLAVLMVNLFRQDEGIAIGVGSRKPGGELEIDAGVVKTWDQWQKCAPPLAEWNQGDGLFYRINPMKRGGKKDEHVTAFRHALVEFDLDAKVERISKEVQFAFVLKFNLPVIALVDSGDKSLHALMRPIGPNLTNVSASFSRSSRNIPLIHRTRIRAGTPDSRDSCGRRAKSLRFWLSTSGRPTTPRGKSNGRRDSPIWPQRV
jgi:hypothetical protein